MCSLDRNQLCGVDEDGEGTYTAEGIIMLSDALKINATLTSLRCAIQLTFPIWKVSAAADTFVLFPSGSLRDNNLGIEGWCAIFTALRDNKDNQIESWDLSQQGINVEIAKVLAEYVSASTALKSLKCAARMLPCPALSAAADTSSAMSSRRPTYAQSRRPPARDQPA